METFVSLFPQFNILASKEEVYFKMLGSQDLHTARMKDTNSRLKEKDGKSRLSLLLARSGSHENVSPEKKKTPATSNISLEAALKWSDSFEDMLLHSDGVETFSSFLRTEFSEENIEFWLACEEYKAMGSESKRISKAKQMYAIYIEAEAPKEINIDHPTRGAIQKNLAKPTRSCFDAAQAKVYSLMKRDCYPRFLTSDIYLRLTKRKAAGATMYRRRSRSCVFNDPSSDSSAWL